MSATKLLLEDALEDNPQSRNLLKLFEQDAVQLREFSNRMQDNALKVIKSHVEIANATHDLAQLAQGYQNGKFPLETNDSILGVTLSQFGRTLEDISSWHQIQAQQLQDSVAIPLSNFIKTDMEELTSLHGMTHLSEQELETSLVKHSRLTKKDSEKKKLEINQEVFHMRHKYHQTMMQYILALNTLQLKRKYALIEPYLGFIQSSKELYKLGIENLLTNDELDSFCENISASVQTVHQELGEETQRLSDTAHFLEEQCLPLYYAEPPKEMSQIRANLSMNQKAGYLNIRFREPKSRLGLTTYRWDRVYVFIQARNLLMQRRDAMVATPLVEIEKGITVHPIEIDDRRFVFQVASGGGEEERIVYIMQAENSRHMDEWIATIVNLVNSDSDAAAADIAKLQLEEFERLSNEVGGAKMEKTNSGVEAAGKTLKEMEAKGERENGSTGKSSESSPSTTSPTDFTPTSAPVTFEILSKNKYSGSSEEPLNRHSTRFLGSLLVSEDRGERVVHEAMRQVLAARAINNVFRSPRVELVVDKRNLDVVDADSTEQKVEARFQLADIAFWTTHKDNDRLFGFVSRQSDDGAAKGAKFRCHVFEAASSASEVSETLKEATNAAYQDIMATKESEVET